MRKVIFRVPPTSTSSCISGISFGVIVNCPFTLHELYEKEHEEDFKFSKCPSHRRILRSIRQKFALHNLLYFKTVNPSWFSNWTVFSKQPNSFCQLKIQWNYITNFLIIRHLLFGLKGNISHATTPCIYYSIWDFCCMLIVCL